MILKYLIKTFCVVAVFTLITSLFLTLYIPQDFSIKKLKEYILNLIKSGLSFLYFLFLFGRLDIFFLKTILFKKDIIGGFVDKEITLIDMLTNNNIASSRREAREFLNSNAISINGNVVNDENLVINKDNAIDNKIIVIRRGKKKYFLGIIK